MGNLPPVAVTSAQDTAGIKLKGKMVGNTLVVDGTGLLSDILDVAAAVRVVGGKKQGLRVDGHLGAVIADFGG